jgi:riboflavin kinase/FMN adenylyltransferase
VKVYTNFEEIQKIKNPILTIGAFDGVHVGHQKIIEQLNKIGNEVGGESVIFTFSKHPRMVLQPDTHGLKLLQSQEEKLEKLEKLGLKHIILYPFTKEFANITAEDFLKHFLLEKLGIHTLVIGYDHQFGKNREGNFNYLQEQSKILPFNVMEIDAQEVDAVNVSSSKIRQAITNGDMRTASHYLNEPFQLWGKVVHGNKLGRTIGYPTANIELNDSLKIIPKMGVYGIQIHLEDNRTLQGMLNIGIKPTINEGNNISIEAHIFDFSENIYDLRIKVDLIQFIREEKKFTSVNELKEQLEKDEKLVRSLLCTS